MAIFELGKEALVPLIPTALEAKNVLERRDLQRLLRVNIEAIAPNTMVLAEEFGEWADSKRRIDLLAVDRQANLVVVELKRSDDAAMELQAIRYAAMVAPMTFEQAVDIHRTFRERVGLQGDPEEAIMQFLDSAQPKEFGTDQKIVLAAADFSKELTTAVTNVVFNLQHRLLIIGAIAKVLKRSDLSDFRFVEWFLRLTPALPRIRTREGRSGGNGKTEIEKQRHRTRIRIQILSEGFHVSHKSALRSHCQTRFLRYFKQSDGGFCLSATLVVLIDLCLIERR